MDVRAASSELTRLIRQDGSIQPLFFEFFSSDGLHSTVSPRGKQAARSAIESDKSEENEVRQTRQTMANRRKVRGERITLMSTFYFLWFEGVEECGREELP
ncbi:hypothetical protein RUM43_002951 [Polyplax serrata]|uniref:Uncharacterized protein n=1 Tax=Polyplax serrata TaxID=468196 RepID=A0AAN8NZF7_POLSC